MASEKKQPASPCHHNKNSQQLFISSTMPARRSNWRQPNTFDDGGEAYTSSGRRTTRVSRGQKQQAPSSRSRARRDKDGTVINVSQSKAPAKLWVQVARPPAPGIRFVVPVWITADELTPEERAHLPAHVQQRLSGDAHNNNTTATSEPGTDADSPDAKRQKTESTTAAVPNENAVAVADSSTTDQVASAPATSAEPMITSPMATQDTAQSQPITSSQQPTLTANSTTISGLPDSSETVQPASEQSSSQITTTTTTTPTAPSEGTGLAPNNATS